MVEPAEIQVAYYMVAATGVLVAALYYIVNLRETTRNRRITLTNNLMQTFTSEEGLRRFEELWKMEWTDFEDFIRKYDSTVNTDNFVKRTSAMLTCEILGRQYRSGLIDFETLLVVCSTTVPQLWAKFKPIILEYRRRGVYLKFELENFEYLAEEIVRFIEKRDPLYANTFTELRQPIR